MQVVLKDFLPAFYFTLHDDVGLGFENCLVNLNVNTREHREDYHLNVLNSWISYAVVSHYGVVASNVVCHIVDLEREIILHPPLKPQN